MGPRSHGEIRVGKVLSGARDPRTRTGRMAQMTGLLTYQGIPVWRHARILQWTTQIVSGFLAVVLVAWFFVNIGGAIQDRNIPYGFSFLGQGVPDANRPPLPPLRVVRLIPLCIWCSRDQHGCHFDCRRHPCNPARYRHRRRQAFGKLDRFQACAGLRGVLS